MHSKFKFINSSKLLRLNWCLSRFSLMTFLFSRTRFDPFNLTFNFFLLYLQIINFLSDGNKIRPNHLRKGYIFQHLLMFLIVIVRYQIFKMTQIDSTLILSPHELNLKFLTYFIYLFFHNCTVFLFCLFYQLIWFYFNFTYPLVCFISNLFNSFLYFSTVLCFYFLQLRFMIWYGCFCILNLCHKFFSYFFRILPQSIPDFSFPTGCILMHFLNILCQNSHLFPIHIRHLYSIS